MSQLDRRQWLEGLAGAGLSLSTGSLWAQSQMGLGPSAVARKSVAPGTSAPTTRPKLAVVLGGGSARGFAHIGVIKALEAFEIKPDVIVGCSAGALVGAFWASGYTGSRMETVAYRVRDEEVIDLVSGNTPNRRGLVSGQALQNFINNSLNSRSIEGLLTPFRAVATKYPSGELHVFRGGDLGFAVRASCSIPGVFLPATQQGQEFLDGGLVSPLPVQTARAEGCDVIVAVDVGGADPGASKDTSGGVYQLLLRSFDIMGDALRRQEAAQATMVIRPDVGRISSTDFAARRALVDAGFMAGQRLAPVILERLKLRGK